MRKYWFLIFLSAPLFAANPQEQDAVLKDLSGGMVSYPSPNEIPDNAATYLQNFYTDIEPIAVERNGYVRRDNTVLGGTKPVYGLWEFVDVSGNDWIISYSSRTYYKNTIGQAPTAFGPIATVDTIPGCDKNLGKFMCVNGTDPVWTFDGTSTATVSGAPLGQLIKAWRTRFAIGNITGSKSTIRFSADGDATNWTLGGNPTDPFAIQIGGANDGDYVRCMYGSYLDTFIIGRKYELWGMDGFDQEDITVRNISNVIGCIEPRTPQEVDGELVWLSARGVEAMNGRTIRLISEPIRDIVDVVAKNTTNQRSNIQTTQADFAAGTTPSALSTSVQPGAVVLSTMAVITSSDDTQVEFQAGTLNTIDATTFPGSLVIGKIFTSTITQNDQGVGTTPQLLRNLVGGCAVDHYQNFVSTFDYYLTSIQLSVKRDAGYAGNLLVTIEGNTATILNASIPTSQGYVTASFSNGGILLGGRSVYKVHMSATNTSSSGSGVYWYFGTSGSPYNVFATTETHPGCSLCTCGDLYSTSEVQTRQYRFFTQGYRSVFNNNGIYTSRTYDLGFTTNTWLFNLGVVHGDIQVPESGGVAISSIVFQTQTSADGVTFDSAVSVANNAVSGSTPRRYRRVVCTFTTLDSSTSPTLNSIQFAAGPFISTGGIYTSQLISIGNLITTWGPITVSDTQSTGTIVYQFGSTSAANVNSISNWTTISNGGVPTVSTNPYAAFRSSFTPTNASSVLGLLDFQTTWSEGGVVPSPVSGIYDRRYWLSFTTTTTSTPVLDTVIVWQRSKTWTLFRGINAGSFTLWHDLFYFGNSNNTGYVYRYDVGNNDDGTDISSVIMSKSYDLEIPYRDKAFRNSFITYTANPAYSGSFSVSYDLDRLGQTFSLGSLSMAEGTGQLSIKLPFSFNNPVQGREIQYKIAKSGNGQRLKLHNIVLKFTPKEEQ